MSDVAGEGDPVLIPDQDQDQDILENRIAAMRELPWVIPALAVIEMTAEDLDNLDAAFDQPHYWSTLNEIVTRIKEAS